ncbi:Protein cornichon [Dirofilaria immitis]
MDLTFVTYNTLESITSSTELLDPEFITKPMQEIGKCRFGKFEIYLSFNQRSLGDRLQIHLRRLEAMNLRFSTVSDSRVLKVVDQLFTMAFTFAAFCYLFALFAVAFCIFFAIFTVICIDELKTDYKNPIEQCNSLNQLVLPEYLLHLILTILFVLSFQLGGLCWNIPLIAYHVHRYIQRPVMTGPGIYDPTTILNKDELQKALREAEKSKGLIERINASSDALQIGARHLAPLPPKITTMTGTRLKTRKFPLIL